MHNIKSLILLADNQPQIRKMLRIALEGDDYRTEESGNGNMTVRLAASLQPDLVIVDTDFTDLTGFEVIRKIREWSKVPIIVVSENSDDNLIAHYLEAGADDYMLKPFNVEVLKARIKSVLRRSIVQESSDTTLKMGDIVIDLMRHEVKVKDKIVPFSPKEYKLLSYLMCNRGKMLTHTQILKKIWGPSHTYDTQYLRVYIGQLRKKIDDPNLPSCIVTEAGVGYRMDSGSQATH